MSVSISVLSACHPLPLAPPCGHVHLFNSLLKQNAQNPLLPCLTCLFRSTLSFYPHILLSYVLSSQSLFKPIETGFQILFLGVDLPLSPKLPVTPDTLHRVPKSHVPADQRRKPGRLLSRFPPRGPGWPLWPPPLAPLCPRGALTWASPFPGGASGVAPRPSPPRSPRRGSSSHGFNCPL